MYRKEFGEPNKGRKNGQLWPLESVRLWKAFGQRDSMIHVIIDRHKWMSYQKVLCALWWGQRLQYEEQLEECKKYKEFLVSLTPLEWFEEQAIAKAQRDAQRRDLASQEGELRHQIRDTCILTFVCSFLLNVCRVHLNTRLNTIKKLLCNIKITKDYITHPTVDNMIRLCGHDYDCIISS